MTRSIFILAVILLTSSFPSFGQEITGDWYGQLDIQGNKLKINFHITEENGAYNTTMDSPDQGALGIPTTKTTFIDDTLEVFLDEMQVHFKGVLKGDKIEGTFKQGPGKLPLTLSKSKVEEEKLVARPQDPKKPYPYKSEEVYFTNPKAHNIKLAGTLTLPKNVKKPPVAILISGSGPQNRDEEVKAFNHRPFLVLADHLTKNGIAVLRYDDRGVAESEGTQRGATSADFATDVEAAVAYLRTRKDINCKKIGLIGHSEGGFIAPMVAAKDKKIAFIVSLAGTGVIGAKILQTQERRANELTGVSKEILDFNENMAKALHKIVIEGNTKKEIQENITSHLTNFKKNDPSVYAAMLTEDSINKISLSFSDEWMTYFIKTDPDQFISKVKCPILLLNGEKDFQVLPDLNLNGFKTSLEKAKNKDVTLMELEGLNHMFQTAETGSLKEYAEIEETFAPKALEIISNWIKARF